MQIKNQYLIVKIILTFFLLLNGVNLYSQTLKNTIEFTSDKLITVTENKITTVLLKLENLSNDTINGRVFLPEIREVKFFSNTELNLKLLPQKKAFIPIKFSLSKNILAQKIVLDFKFYDLKDNNQFISTATELEIPQKNGVKIFQIPTVSNYKKIGDSITYEVKAVNIGSTNNKVNLISTYKDYLGRVLTETKSVDLLPFEEKNIKFLHYVNYDIIKLDKFTSTVVAYDKENKYSGNVIYTIYNVNSSRTFTSGIANAYDNGNYASLEILGSDSKITNYNFSFHDEISNGFNEYAYNFNAYTSGFSDDILYSNIWFDYARKSKGVRIGNISYGNLELPVYGRGLMVYQNINQSDIQNQSNNKIVAGIVENNNDVFDDVNIDLLKRRTAVFANSNFMINENELESSMVYQHTNNLRNLVISNKYSWSTPHKWQHNIKFGFGNSSTHDYSESKNSFALSANVSGKINSKVALYSTNYYSTPYYTGGRKGVLDLNERLQISLSKFTIYGISRFLSVRPKSIITTINDYLKLSESTEFSLETGVSFRFSNKLSAKIYPRFNFETSYYLDEYNRYIKANFNSNYLNSSFYLSSNSRESQFVFNFSGGYYKFSNFSTSKTIYSGSVNWSYKRIRANAQFQKGNFVLSDRINGYSNDAIRYNFRIAYRESFLKNRLNLDFSSVVNYTENSGSNLGIGVNSYYTFRERLKVTNYINLNFNKSQNNIDNQAYYQLGLQYIFSPKINSNGQKFGNLKLFVFYDYNTNGIFDEGDKIADNRFVNVKDVSFSTNSSGEILYKKIPYGEYKITIPGQKWYAKETSVYIQNKQTTIAIPMQLTGTVRGRIKIQSRSKLEVEVQNNLYGTVLVFIDENDKKHEVQTNSKGEFTAYLPIGEYTFYVQENTLPTNTYPEVYSHKVTVEAEKSIEFPIIKLLIKEKKVNIKRFGS